MLLFILLHLIVASAPQSGAYRLIDEEAETQEYKRLVQSHAAGAWPSWDTNPGQVALHRGCFCYPRCVPEELVRMETAVGGTSWMQCTLSKVISEMTELNTGLRLFMGSGGRQVKRLQFSSAQSHALISGVSVGLRCHRF